MAGLTGQFLTYPLDRARAVMAVTKVGQYRNIVHVFKDIIAKERISALYVGIAPSMLGVVVYAGTSFYTFESLKYLVRLRTEDRVEPTGAEKFMCGACAGLIGQTISYPLDIVRRRMQTSRQMGLGANRYTSIATTLLTVLQ